MSVSKKILDYLKKKKYKFEIIEHKTTYTAFDTARTTQKLEKKIRPEEFIKTLIVKADKDYFLALVPASRKLDKNKLRKVVNTVRKKNKEKLYKSINLAKEAWMKKNIIGKVGATPAFKELTGLEIYIDAVLAKQINIYVGSGEYEYSLKLPAKQYINNEAPIKGSFGVKK
ncbi:MAG: hypothetical protein A2359_00695 [Candidatus Moranbacteria bacterium RIFOXYB1_FULL_43_19]|nr:MAG: hypothetical protein A2184_03685 [Candidatus Moranbacteria bacterium RIFOXYA1_FULL_44_7]OGI27311.1 MAG: hypothetical protein A2359_00695 [Candidatus Moranbacteria bacterium RIFOXYB1_FULL_43_19]OGI33815.1 MAG: hypothetical protein A2420_05335 [Candidatus Moranbacteria bacterium RIFOXYC1_FULL_44_13]OGI38763.1 MAG: hypothetical protein A2612_00995 [Candidatus Moranbacteria bacterium RIFOXYD1_FULL_44_12]